MADQNIQYQFGTSRKLYILKGCTGGKSCLYELHKGYHFRGRDRTDEEEHNLTFIKFVCLDAKRKKRLEELASSEVGLSDASAFEHVVRYEDYVPLINALVTDHLDWQGIDPRKAAMSDDVVLYVAWDMLQALAYLHGRGVVHGDIRPQNFLSYPRFPSSSRNHAYSYKLMGHGLVPKVIRDWSFPGSAYTAPELRGRKYKPTFASDVWMLGLALWELHAYGLSHKVPRSSKPVAEMSAAEFVGLEKRVKGCHGYNHGILGKLLREMLVRNPRGRATAMGALTSLAEFRFRSNEGGTLEVDLQRVEEAIGHARKEMWQRSVLGRAAERVKRLVGRLLVFMIALWVRVL